MDLNPETFRRIMVKKTDGLYNLDDKSNKILSSQIEKKYNILNADVLDSIISGNLGSESLVKGEFMEKILQLLEAYKKDIDDKQKETGSLK